MSALSHLIIIQRSNKMNLTISLIFTIFLGLLFFILSLFSLSCIVHQNEAEKQLEDIDQINYINTHCKF